MIFLNIKYVENNDKSIESLTTQKYYWIIRNDRKKVL